MKSIGSHGIFLLVFILFFLLSMPVLATSLDTPGKGLNKSSKEINYKAAIEKQCLFVKFESDRIYLIDEKTYQHVSYLVAEDVRILFHDQPIERSAIMKHSAIKVVIIEAVVVEIIVEEVPS